MENGLATHSSILAWRIPMVGGAWWDTVCRIIKSRTWLSNCWGPAWGTPPMAKVMRKEAQHTKRRDQASGVPLEILKHLPPKPESAYFTALCSHLHLWLYGGLSPTTSFGEGVNLELQLIKTPGHDKSVLRSKYQVLEGILWQFQHRNFKFMISCIYTIY